MWSWTGPDRVDWTDSKVNGIMRVKSIVNSIMNSMTYILFSEDVEYVWVVDCGDIRPLLDEIGNRPVKGVMLTHAHYDHIYGLPELLRIFPECMVYTNMEGINELGSARLNLSRYHGVNIEIDKKRTVSVTDNYLIELFPDRMAKVIESPGHNPSCLIFEVEDCLFTGDSYIPGLKPVTNLPGGNKEQAVQSLKRIEHLLHNHTVYAGHPYALLNYDDEIFNCSSSS